jgi:histone-lysine N-methyltransferase SETMAR
LDLHHDIAPAHKALSVKQFLAQKSITEVEHPPYSPYLAPNDFCLFQKIKSASKGQRFQDTENIQKVWRWH